MKSAARAARPAAASAPPPKARRPDGRAARTIEKIIGAAQEAMLNYGSARVSVREVCDQAGVSRGTLYRYFSSMEDVLQAVALRLRTETDEELRHALEKYDDPWERFSAFLAYTASNRETTRAAHFLHVEPDFVLRYFESNFAHFKARVNDALGPVFDAWERDIGEALDRDAICETMVRFALSETLIPTLPGKTPLPARLRAMAELVLRQKSAAR